MIATQEPFPEETQRQADYSDHHDNGVRSWGVSHKHCVLGGLRVPRLMGKERVDGTTYKVSFQPLSRRRLFVAHFE